MASKYPALRIADFHTATELAPGFVKQIKDFFTIKVIPLLPFIVVGVELDGSYAEGKADFHSDFDINLATGSKQAWLVARALIRDNPEQVQAALEKLQRYANNQLGIYINISLEAPAIKDIPVKRCYDFLTGQWYNDQDPNTKKRWDWNPDTLSWRERLPRPIPRYTFTGLDEVGNVGVEIDQWASILPTWRARYQGQMLELDTSPETR